MNKETLFDEALSRSPEERAAFLDQACVGRPKLRAAVEALLAAHEQSGDILERLVAGIADFGPGQARPAATSDDTSVADDASATSTKTFDYGPMSEPGVVIAGRYGLQEKIGEGGMGEVWVAKQTEPVKRKVALKLIKTGMDSRAVLQRFNQERQALALMDHPNIAKVLDGGLTPTGQPFFVMELVNGLLLTKFCDEARLTTKERLELFVAICQAVQHAHQKGIVHRDLKPANILVTIIDGKPVPKVIDFGVAKATAGKLTDVSLSTQFGAVVGTLEYMSPEQASFSGEDIDTRADIYSLGVILYELLTGLRPLDAKRLRKAALTEMVRIIREEEPAKPSTRLSTDESLPSMAALRHTDPRKLMALLRGELDWVVMKCLEKHRERRYETANGLARDIQRYLADEPVEARPPSAGYRLRKFVRRHKGQVIAASLVLLALVAGMAGTTWGLIREAKANVDLSAANTKVEARYNLAVDAIKTFHTGVSEDFLLKEEKFKELRNRLLKSASDFYGKLGALLGKETDLDSRRALAQANFELADLTGKVGSPEDALAAHRRVLAARETLAAGSRADPEIKADVGRSLTAVSTLLWSTGKTKEAEAMYRKAETLLVELAPTIAGTAAVRVALADCRRRLGYLLEKEGRYDEALSLYRLARADLEALADAPGATAELRWNLVSTVNRTGAVLRDTGKPAEAEAELRTALALQQKLVDDNPTGTELRFHLADGHNNLGIVLYYTARPSEALAEWREALALHQKLADDNPAVTQFRSALSGVHSNLVVVLSEKGELSEAEIENRKALALRQKLVDDNPAVTKFQYNLAGSYNNLAHMLQRAGKPVEAEAELRHSLAIKQKLADDNPKVPDYRESVALALHNLGELAHALGREAEARDDYNQAVALRERLVAENPTRTLYRSSMADALRRRGLARRALGDPSGAAADVRRALGLYEELPSRSADEWFETACCHAALASLAGRDGAEVSAAEGTAEADHAMALIRKAVDMGYRDGEAFRTDSALDPIRDREDFKKLLAELEKTSPAKPKGASGEALVAASE